jgi:aminoglycoside phosphotransferase family enzyme/predicted kinase
MKSQATKQVGVVEWLKMVESLRSARDWTGEEQPAEIIQTHISAVLLSSNYALKLKKPLNLGFLDYTTVEKRRAACEAEIALNRRLCGDTYLRVLPIRNAAGRIQTSGDGQIIDYAVLMKRLPADSMLDHLVAKDEVSEAIIDRVALRLQAFHQQARRGPEVDRYASPEWIRANWEENFAQTAPYVDRSIAASAFESIRIRVNGWLHDASELLGRRIAGGHICDGHGDVRCESICVTDGLCIFDCIEFNERFRCGDVASDVAFLAMDLDARGRPDLGYYFTDRYQVYGPDPDLFALLPFYRCYRAYVRGKVMSFRLDRPEFTETEQRTALVRARHYFNLAGRYVNRLSRPTVIVVSGLSGTGKTAIGRAIAGELGLRVVSSDAVRKSIFGPDIRAAGYGDGAYSDAANSRTYEAMTESARTLLADYGAVVLDATFRRESDRAAARELAASKGAAFRLIECRLSPEAARSRMERRERVKEGLSDATWETYKRQRSEFQPIKPSPDSLVLDTAADLAVASRFVTDWLRQSARR